MVGMSVHRLSAKRWGVPPAFLGMDNDNEGKETPGLLPASRAAPPYAPEKAEEGLASLPAIPLDRILSCGAKIFRIRRRVAGRRRQPCR